MARRDGGGRKLSGRMRLADLLRPRHERSARRVDPAAFAEEEVRARIYGWHSGTVERPEPADSSRLSRAGSGSSAVEDAGAPSAPQAPDEPSPPLDLAPS